MIERLQKLAQFIETEKPGQVRVQALTQVQSQDSVYPLWSFQFGSTSATAPVLLITGGVHGLERIGAQLAWSLLKTTMDRSLWDQSLQHLLEKVRILFVPLVNPVGYQQSTRSNGNGVDLMRNSPLDALESVPWLAGGQRHSAMLPWFRGNPQSMEAENQALEKLFVEQALQSPCVLSFDFHSGFGMKDRLWFPYAHTTKPFDHLAEVHALVDLLKQTHPYHIYQFEPQSNSYLLHGDLWDHFYLQYRKQNPRGVFIPMTLEMGSWLWVRKNPAQLFSRHGIFNPMKEHRIKRTYRRHHLLFDFMLKALLSNRVWAGLDEIQREKHLQRGLEKWHKPFLSP